jgi:hypothetical protein
MQVKALMKFLVNCDQDTNVQLCIQDLEDSNLTNLKEIDYKPSSYLYEEEITLVG